MIVDINRFITEGRPAWRELEEVLEAVAAEPSGPMDLEGVKRFHYLYQRASADLARVGSMACAPELRDYLEGLVGRAYAEIHETREAAARLAPLAWFLHRLPRTFRRHLLAFWVSLIAMLAGCLFGAGAMGLDPDAKEILLPFSHLSLPPSQRVAQEETASRDRLAGVKTRFSSFLMTHNIRVSILLFALGMTWGVGTLILLFGNGVLLGAVAMDYLRAGEAAFLGGWLLPHGSVEIPAMVFAGQAGLVLAGALIGRGESAGVRERLRSVSGDLVTLILGVALLLVWAGLVEAFLSQYHEPVFPYVLKITFGLVELSLLSLLLARGGRSPADSGQGGVKS